MSLKLLVDEDSQAQPFVNMLRVAGHDVITVNEAGLQGSGDPVVLDYARGSGRILLTHNCRDFLVLHEENPNHPGILGIHRDRNFSKNMNHQDLVKAITKLETALPDLTNQFIGLNHWK